MPPTSPSTPGTPDTAESPIKALQDHLGAKWSHIGEAERAAAEKRNALTQTLDDLSLSADTGLLVFGSLARGEWTTGSDVDWTLLVDGQADPNHFRVARSITDRFEKAGVKRPGRTGVFGGLAFSHQIVHDIGGEADTNPNTTRRILLLLESCSIGQTTTGQPDDVRDRVIRAVIDRYLEDDPSLLTASREGDRVPRFLLNDIVRFWRTMAVDYASKRRERGDEGWALRNAKLRFSRKLVFVAGLLCCFSAALDPEGSALATDSPNGAAMVQYLRSTMERTPLEILAEAAGKYCDTDTAKRMFNTYDDFVGILADADKRDHLKKLAPPDSPGDALFQEMRKTSDEFQQSLTTLFFGSHDTLSRLSMKYGLF